VRIILCYQSTTVFLTIALCLAENTVFWTILMFNVVAAMLWLYIIQCKFDKISRSSAMPETYITAAQIADHLQ